MNSYIGNSPGVGTGTLAINKNHVINPTFNVNQRGFAGGALATGVYGFDRWMANGDGISMTLPSAAGFVTISGVSASTFHGIQHRLEKFGYSGQVTISWEGTSELFYYEANGKIWTATGATSPHTITIDDTVAHDVTDAVELLTFSNGTLKNLKVEVGSVQTPFEYPDISSELAKCQRYYYNMVTRVLLPLVNSDNTIREHTLVLPVTMRAAPTVTASANFGTFGYLPITPPHGIDMYVTGVIAGNAVAITNIVADAEL